MVNMTKILDPRGESETAERKVPPLPSSLNGKVIGFLDNGKPNADLLIFGVEESLTSKFQFSEIVKVRKKGPGATTTDILDKLARCDLVINGLGD